MPVNQRGDAGPVLQRHVEFVAEAVAKPLLAVRPDQREGLGGPAHDLDLARLDHQLGGSRGPYGAATRQDRGQAGSPGADQEISAVQHGAPRSFQSMPVGSCRIHLL
jgi:hypothetical protein